MADRSRYCLQSYVTKDYLQELVEGRFLPPKAECAWRIPGAELEPELQGDKRVVLVSHLLRDMTLPPSAFFSAILEYYGLQPHNIEPNSILVLAGFQALFEGYLGIAPTVDHFKYCFLCRRQTIASGELANYGSVTFNCRQGDWYPKIPYNESVTYWTSTFFIVKTSLHLARRWVFPPSSTVPPNTNPSGQRR